MGNIDDIANTYVTEWAPLDPLGASYAGISGYDHLLTDVSPAGFATLADLDRRTLAALDEATPASERERVAKEAMQERLGLAVERYDAGETTSELNVISSALHNMRSSFDLMPLVGDDAAANIAARLNAMPHAVEQFKQTLREAAVAGHVASRHQMIEIAKQCDVWSDPAGDNFFPGLVQRTKAAGPVSDALAAIATH